MWTFLITEVLFFGGMFTAYAIYRALYPDAFASTSEYMNVLLGGTNTAVLICSSLTMVLAVRAAQLSNRGGLILFLVLTMVFGTIFLVIKAFEYHSKWVEHLVPGFNFQYEPAQFAHHAQLLFFLYFCMTGMHALHMVIGLGSAYVSPCASGAQGIQRQLFCARRNDWPLLALRGCCLDLPLPTAVSDWQTLWRRALMSEHIVPVKNYVAVFIALLLLTGLTTKVSFMDLGQTAIGKTHVIDWNTVAALVIAVAKMLLVVLFFMHVKYSRD